MSFVDAHAESGKLGFMKAPPKSENIAIGQRIKALRESLRLTQLEVARALGVERGAVANWEGGKGLKRENLVKLAQLFRQPVEILIGEADDLGHIPALGARPELKAMRGPDRIPVVGIAEAGVFRAVELFDDAPVDYIAAARDERFPHARHMAFKVEGDSMNRAGILPGDTVICVDWVEAGVELRDGLKVIVERTLDGGHTRELTVKEVRIGEGYVNLTPVSTNARHQPIRVPIVDLDDGSGVSIVALVVSKTTRLF